MPQTIDYQDVGLIAGLEVHQQLLTDRKMFCNCPAGLYTKEHDGEVLRHMRPTLSELGDYDGTALMEFKTKKNIIYLLHKSNVCTYEMDDTPPFLMNEKALDVAVEQCLMLKCDIVDEVHVARKQYLDGSIPTGFQRTAIVGVNGKLPFLGRELSITQVSVEEDSCREVYDKGHLIVWRTDRLGMPLIETVTGPDLRTPDEVVEAILLIGRVCRSTCHVRVGLGASRQDINVSVRGGRRVEIKGVPQAWWAKSLVQGEAVRQVNLLKLAEKLRTLGFKNPEDINISHKEVTKLFDSSPIPYLRSSEWQKHVKKSNRPTLEFGEGPFCVRAVKLIGLSGTLQWPTQPNYDFAHELAGRVRVISGLDQPPVLIHSDEWPQFENSQAILEKIKSTLSCGDNDSVVLVWGPLKDTLTAAEEIRIRYVDALEGIPHETRQPFVDGHTDFERILPGPNRMYPDTDSPPIRMTRERVERLRAKLPPSPWEREEKYAAVGIPRNTIHYLLRRGGAALVDSVMESCSANLRQACYFFGERLKGLRRKGLAVDTISQEKWCDFFAQLSARPVLCEDWQQLVELLVRKPESPMQEIIELAGLNNIPENVEQFVDKIIQINKDNEKSEDTEKLSRYYMGIVMEQLRGIIPAQDVGILIRKILTKNKASKEHFSQRQA